MNIPRVAAITALTALVCIGAAFADDSAAGALPAWVMPLIGQKLVAVDGSSLVLAPHEGGISLTRTAPSGASQATSFVFLSNKLGTISESGEGGSVVGFFRLAETSIEVQYADGRTESLFANSGHGLSLTDRGPGDRRCVSWYPSDHLFGVAERRAAVAAFAASLGLSESAKGKAKTGAAPSCVAAAKSVQTAAKSVPPPLPMAVQAVPIAPKSHYTIADTAPAGPLAPLVPIAVRASDVHAVPGASVTKQPETPATPQPEASATTQPATRTPVLVAAASPASSTAVAPGRGASDCLHVESDGSNLGFRNRCSFSVQFVYCLQSKDDPRAICNLETRTGNVAASGFAPLLNDTNIRAADAEHDFRWVACSGAPSDVTAYLDRTEPPSGRCVRANAS